MGKLSFETLMSGIRVRTKEELGETKFAMTYKEIPQELRKYYIFTLKDISISFNGNDTSTFFGMEYVSKGKIEEVRIKQELLDSAYCRFDGDDSTTMWVYMNRKDLWQELLEYFKDVDTIMSKYIRWNH